MLCIILNSATASINVSVVRQPFCDESGVGFGAHYLAENSTALWSHHSILRSDEFNTDGNRTRA